MLSIKVNGEPRSFVAEASIEDVLAALQIRRERGIAVALNYSVVSQNQLKNTLLKNGDELEIIYATSGG